MSAERALAGAAGTRPATGLVGEPSEPRGGADECDCEGAPLLLLSRAAASKPGVAPSAQPPIRSPLDAAVLRCSKRWLAAALLACVALWLLFSAAARLRTLPSVAGWFGSGAELRASFLYGGRFRATAVSQPSRLAASAASASPPFPALTALLAGHGSASSASLPGVASFERCMASSAGGGRVAVVSTRSSHPTAAMLSVASLQSGWCVIALSELGGAAWSDWTSEASRSAALLDFDRARAAVSRTGGHSSSASSASSSPSSLLSLSSFSRLCYIDAAEQRRLPYSVSPLVASGSANVRQLGYLLAMHAAAAAILDLHEHTVYLPDTAHTASDDLPYERDAAHFLSAQSFARTVRHQHQPQHRNSAASDASPAVNVRVLNAYPLFGQANSWPRGLPVHWVGATLHVGALSLDGVCLAGPSQPQAARRLCRPVVQHFLAGHYIDVDSLQVATSSSPRRPPFDFLAPTGRHTQPHTTRHAPAVAVPSGTYAPFNARSTLFLPEVFASLLMPNNKQRADADIARAFVIQTALTYHSTQQGANHCLVLAPPHFADLAADHHSDQHSGNDSTTTSSQQSERMARLLGWLAQRQKGGSRQMGRRPSSRFVDVVQWLYAGLHEAGELDEADAALVNAWLSDVSRLPHSLTAQQEESAEATIAAAAVQLPNAFSPLDCFPHYSLPAADLSRPSASVSRPSGPSDVVLASDGSSYPLSDYADGFLFPDKYASGAFIDERALHDADPSTVKPAGRWLPYPPHRHPPKPRVDFILRAFSGYSPLTSYMLRSLDTFVPWRQLGSTIVVLDDSDADRQYAASLPDDVEVRFEAKPAFFDEWGAAQQTTGALGVARQANGYALGLYSNWISDRYSSADYICVLDPDMLFISRGSLPLMFDWDEQQRLYKPIWICRDEPEELFVTSSYELFGLDRDSAPGCMYQLPVCIHRATLQRVRLRLNADFNRSNPADYAQLGLDPASDRDSNYEQYGRHYDAQRAATGSAASQLLPPRSTGVPPAAFDRTYMRMVNRQLAQAVCQFCVWGSFIMIDPAERSLYSLRLQGNKRDHSSCPQLRAATHSGYLVPQPKMSPAYYQLADQLLMDGLCRAAQPADCLAPVCQLSSHWYDALAVRSAGGALPGEVLAQALLFKWETHLVFIDGPHDLRCRPYTMAAAQQLYEWIQHFDLAHPSQRDKHCSRVALTDSAGTSRRAS